MTRGGGGRIVEEAARGLSGGATDTPLSSRWHSELDKPGLYQHNITRKEEKTNSGSVVGTPAASDARSSWSRCVDDFLWVRI
jgi:hypothetical protein